MAAVFAAGSAMAHRGFAAGGYTGGTEGLPAGTVHGNEYVLSAPAVRQYGIPTLDAMNRGALGFAPSGAPSGAGSKPAAAPVNNNHYFLFDRTEFSRMMQQDSAGWFHDMSAQFARKNGTPA
jgi:hypothetical protein